MRSNQLSGASGAPSYHPPALQRDRLRRRVAISDAVASVVVSLAYGEPREPLAWAWSVPTASGVEVRQ